MARINSNIPSLIARANLQRTNQDLEVRLQRLATGLRINRGADDPAGLIISERIRSDINGLNQAVKNNERASSVIATTEGALNEISELLRSVQGLIVEAANTGAVSNEERQANQLQIDSAIQSITRISNSANFGGLKLLNGELDYVLSGLASSAINKASISNAALNGQSSIQVDVEVIASAQTANLFLSSTSGAFSSTVTLEIAGPLGVQTIDVLSGTTIDNVISAINQFREVTGVSAAQLNGADTTSGLVFSSIDFGESSFVSVKRLGGPSGGGFFQPQKLPDTAPAGAFSFSDAAQVALLTQSGRDIGRDIAAVVNGALANGNGLTASVANPSSLSVELLLDATFATTVGSTSTFHVTGGGALYQLGGEINSTQQFSMGVQSVAASRLGGTLIGTAVEFLNSIQTGGNNDLKAGNFQNTSKIIKTAIDEITILRGRLGALERNTLQTNVRSLQTAIENLTSSESRIRDADFAAESSALTRAQILSQSGTSVLALANAQSQSVLQLLG